LTGFSGEKAEKTSIKLLEEGLADVIASDAHSCEFRMDEFKKGLYVAQDIVGEKRVTEMVVTVPSMIIDNSDIAIIKKTSGCPIN